MKIVRISVVVIGFASMILGSVLVGSHVVWSQEPTSTPVPTATATPTPTATPTIDPMVQFRKDKITYCLNSVSYYYLSRTGIALEFTSTVWIMLAGTAEVTGTVDSTDERFGDPMTFRCVFEEFMDVPMMLTIVEVTEGE
jgi:disulfide bond formation protein DsbB